MSGSSDYTTTPNLGLYKPTYDADEEQWGTHLNLNSDTLDAAFSPTSGVFLPLAGGAMGGSVSLAGISTAPLAVPGTSTSQIASTAFVSAAVTGLLTDAPTDGQSYARMSSTWQPVLSLGGGTLAGPLLLAADPTAPLGAATAQYADGAVNRAGGPFLPLATGGTVAGATTFSGAGVGLVVSNSAQINGGSLIVGGGAGTFATIPLLSAAGRNRSIGIFTATTGAAGQRWNFGGSNTAEGGSNTGTDFVINRFDDAGASLPNALTITRSTGAVTVNGTFRAPAYISPNIGGVISGPPPQLVSFSSNFSGTASGATTPVYDFQTTSNSADWTAVSFLQGRFTQNFGGGKGSLGGLFVGMTQTAAQTDTSASSVFYNPVNASVSINYPAPGGSVGTSAIGISGGAFVGAGATGWGLVEGMELGLNRQSGSSILRASIATVIHSNTGSSAATTGYDAGYTIAATRGTTVAGLKQGFLIGRDDVQFPVDSTGWIMQAVPQTAANTSGNLQTTPSACVGGIDLWTVNFSNTAFRAPGVALGNAVARVGSGSYAQGASGPTIDATGSVGSISGIAVAGVGYRVNDQLYDGLGGIILVTAIGGGGAITAASYIAGKEPYFFGTGPATVNATGGSGNGSLVTFNVNWTARTTLALNPSGGATTVGGNLTATNGVFNAPRMLYITGATVGNGADTTEDILQVYTLPANMLVVNNDCLHIVAGGTFASSTDSKTARLRFGGIAGTNISSVTGAATNAQKWFIEAWITRTGATTQSTIALGSVLNTAANNGVNAGTSGATLSASIDIVITGTNTTTASAGSVNCSFLRVDLTQLPH